MSNPFPRESPPLVGLVALVASVCTLTGLCVAGYLSIDAGRAPLPPMGCGDLPSGGDRPAGTARRGGCQGVPFLGPGAGLTEAVLTDASAQRPGSRPS